MLTQYDDTRALLFLSHSHWDHIQGFPLFAPVYREGLSLDILGSPVRASRLEEIFSRQQDADVFPIPLVALQAKLQIAHFGEDWASFGSTRMRAF